jgi:5-methylcytosine-specific restriction enzyme subunit McrC
VSSLVLKISIPPWRTNLGVINRKLVDVADIPLSLDAFRGVFLHQNDSHNAFLIRLCYFVCRHLLPSTSGTGSRFLDVLRDEEGMSRIFEEFIRNFYYYEQDDCHVASEEMSWSARELSASEYNMIPVMRTDVTMRSSDMIAIIDAKYYTNPFPLNYGKRKLRAQHLYQLYSYLRHAKIEARNRNVAGAIVYASVHEPLLKRYEIDGFPIVVLALDLSRAWSEIHNELLNLPKALSHMTVTSTSAQSKPSPRSFENHSLDAAEASSLGTRP